MLLMLVVYYRLLNLLLGLGMLLTLALSLQPLLPAITVPFKWRPRPLLPDIIWGLEDAHAC